MVPKQKSEQARAVNQLMLQHSKETSLSSYVTFRMSSWTPQLLEAKPLAAEAWGTVEQSFSVIVCRGAAFE